jgi:hypothetical protein
MGLGRRLLDAVELTRPDAAGPCTDGAYLTTVQRRSRSSTSIKAHGRIDEARTVIPQGSCMHRRSSDARQSRLTDVSTKLGPCRSTLMDVSTKLGRASMKLNDVGMKLVASAPPFKGGPTELVTAPVSFIPGPGSLVRAGMRKDAPGIKLPREGPSHIGAPPSLVGSPMKAHGLGSESHGRGAEAHGGGPVVQTGCASPIRIPLASARVSRSR